MRILIVFSAALFVTVPGYSQTVPAPTAPAQTFSLPASLQRSYNQAKAFITAQAAAVPETDYGFRPTADVRTFGELMGHIADYNYIFCTPARGIANPREGQSFETLRTKAELTKALADSFAFCDAAFSSLTETSAAEMVRQGANTVTRAGSLLPLLVHDYEEYGYASVYLRLRGIVPPSTQRTVAPPPR